MSAGNNHMESILEETDSNDSLSASAHLEQERRDKKTNNRFNRRQVLAATGSVLAGTALAGCGEEQPDPQTPEPSRTPEPSETPSPTDEPTEEPTDEPTETESKVEQFEPDVDFGTVYRKQMGEKDNPRDTGERFLTDAEVREIKDPIRSKIDEIEDTADKVISHDDVDPRELDKALREAVYNELGYDENEVIVNGRFAGDGGGYTTILHKEEDGWGKTLMRASESLRQGDEPSSPNTEQLHALWDEDDQSNGALWEMDGWRAAIQGHFSPQSEEKWLEGSSLADDKDDCIVIGHDDHDDRERELNDYFGKIGFSRLGEERPATDVIDSIMDQHERESFEHEAELVQNLSVFYDDALPNDHKKAITDEAYIRVATWDKTEKDLEEGVAEKPYKLTEADDGTELWATVVGYEEHKEDAYNMRIPETKWPEGAYPEGGVEMKQEFQEDEMWTWEEE